MRWLRFLAKVGTAILVVAAVVAVTASGATAAEGPYYKRCKNVGAGNGSWKDANCSEAQAGGEFELFRLLEGSPTIEASMQKEYQLEGGSLLIKCKKQKLEGASLVGMPKNTAGWSVETIVFEECSVEKNGTPCEPYSEMNEGKKELGVIRTKPLSNILDYGEKEPKKGTKVLVLFEPIKTLVSTPPVFVNIKFTGTGCKVPTALVEGSVEGEAWNGSKAVVKVEEPSETLAEANFVNFPEALITKDFVEAEKVIKEVKPSLKVAGLGASKFVGTTEVKLASKEHWGVFAK
jgi:hypothetical protein